VCLLLLGVIAVIGPLFRLRVKETFMDVPTGVIINSGRLVTEDNKGPGGGWPSDKQVASRLTYGLMGDGKYVLINDDTGSGGTGWEDRATWIENNFLSDTINEEGSPNEITKILINPIPNNPQNPGNYAPLYTKIQKQRPNTEFIAMCYVDTTGGINGINCRDHVNRYSPNGSIMIIKDFYANNCDKVWDETNYVASNTDCPAAGNWNSAQKDANFKLFGMNGNSPTVQKIYWYCESGSPVKPPDTYCPTASST